MIIKQQRQTYINTITKSEKLREKHHQQQVQIRNTDKQTPKHTNK